jgi:hypothetical protein
MFLLSFLSGFSILYRGLPQAIYVEDLSIFSYYRYLTLLIFTIIVAILWIILKYNAVLLPIFSIILYPHLKEQMRIILFTWDEGFLGWLNNRLIHILQLPKGRYIFYGIRIV